MTIRAIHSAIAHRSVLVGASSMLHTMLRLASMSINVRSTQPAIALAIDGVIINERLLERAVGTIRMVLDRRSVHRVPRIRRIDKRLETFAVTRVLLHDLLVLAQSAEQFLFRNVVQKDARADRVWYRSPQQAVTSLQDCLRAVVEDVFIELVVIH